MHKLIEYICEELDELERKAEKEKSLSAAEMQYVDLLAHAKKNLLKAEEMSEDMEYSSAYEDGYGNSYARGGQGGNRGGGNRGGGRNNSSYARGRGRNARRDSMGRYSREGGYSMDGGAMVEELRDLMQDAPDEQTRMEFQRFISKIEQMQ